MNDTRQIAWMRQQWRRFLVVLWSTTALAWMLCISGILLLDWEAWGVRLALVVLLVSTTAVCLRFSQTARRQQKRLGRLAADLRHHQDGEKGFS